MFLLLACHVIIRDAMSIDYLLKCTDIPIFCEILNKYGKPQEYKQNSIYKHLDYVCAVVNI
jgi:hypothetical protein